MFITQVSFGMSVQTKVVLVLSVSHGILQLINAIFRNITLLIC